MVSFRNVQEACRRVGPFIHRTPVLTCDTIDQLLGSRVYFKCENFQKCGAFKIRGAVNAVAQLSEAELGRGVVTHSSGNHAAALARAAQMYGCPAYVVMPSNSTQIKKDAVQSYGGLVTECEPTLAARIAGADAIQHQTGAILIPPFDHPDVIAGQGTCAVELLQQVNDLDAIMAPVGGGGLISGTCLAARSIKPDILILGGEPEGANDAFLSKRQGDLVPQLNPNTISDGLRTSLGELTWPFVRDEVDEIITANDEETVSAMRLLWERAKIVVEPSSAVCLAALLKRFANEKIKPQRIGVILTGGNVDLGKPALDLQLPAPCSTSERLNLNCRFTVNRFEWRPRHASLRNGEFSRASSRQP